MPDVYDKIRAEYIRGGVTYRELSDKYGVSASMIAKRSQAESWRELRSKRVQKAVKKIVNAAADADARRADKFVSIADKLLDRIENDIDNGVFALSQRGYRDLTGALKDLRDIKNLNKTDLDLREQIARIEKLEAEAKSLRGEDAPKQISIIIDGGDDYSD